MAISCDGLAHASISTLPIEPFFTMRYVLILVFLLLPSLAISEDQQPNGISESYGTLKTEGFIALANDQGTPLIIRVHQPFNWYLLALPLLTLVIVVCGTKMSINATNEAMEAQIEISSAALISSERKSQFEVLANSRQDWINSLRDSVSSFLCSAQRAHFMIKVQKQSPKAEMHEMLGHYFKIRLLINSQETDHLDLVNKCLSLLGVISTKQDADKDIFAISDITQVILKREWDRLKSGS